jgi:hypothetical protein
MTQQSLSPFSLKNTVAPFENVNGKLVNIDASNWPGSFGSTETSLQFGLPAVRNNVAAAAASAIRGGSRRKTIRRKIKNIANKYRMPPRKRRSMKKRLIMNLKGGYIISKSKKNKRRRSSSSSSSGRARGRGRGSKKIRGGGSYHQFGSQIPNTPSYATPGFKVGPSDSALAVAVPYSVNGGAGTCTDNYNHYTNKGFQFW